MYSNIKWQSSTVQNCNYFCTNLVGLCKPEVNYIKAKVIADNAFTVIKSLQVVRSSTHS